MADPLAYEKLLSDPSTALQRRDLALSTLRGLIEGIEADDVISRIEIDYLTHWLAEHKQISRGVDMADLQQVVLNALNDGGMSLAERADVINAIERLRSPGYYNNATHAIQLLHGLLAGIACDGEISRAELLKVQEWIEQHAGIREYYPVADIDSMITAILDNGRIPVGEHRVLVDFCSQWVAIGGHRSLQPGDVGHGHIFTGGVTTTYPDLHFADRAFCVTGASLLATRRQLEQLITDRGGQVMDLVDEDLDYLIYCSQGNACWAYSCYGRKVEEALALRDAGGDTLIVAEADFWSALIAYNRAAFEPGSALLL